MAHDPSFRHRLHLRLHFVFVSFTLLVCFLGPVSTPLACFETGAVRATARLVAARLVHGCVDQNLCL